MCNSLLKSSPSRWRFFASFSSFSLALSNNSSYTSFKISKSISTLKYTHHVHVNMNTLNSQINGMERNQIKVVADLETKTKLILASVNWVLQMTALQCIHCAESDGDCGDTSINYWLSFWNPSAFFFGWIKPFSFIKWRSTHLCKKTKKSITFLFRIKCARIC